MDVVADGHESEDARVAFWRYERFRKMGFSHEQTCNLHFWGVDLHDAEFLVSRGCKHHLAVVILEPMH